MRYVCTLALNKLSRTHPWRTMLDIRALFRTTPFKACLPHPVNTVKLCSIRVTRTPPAQRGWKASIFSSVWPAHVCLVAFHIVNINRWSTKCPSFMKHFRVDGARNKNFFHCRLILAWRDFDAGKQIFILDFTFVEYFTFLSHSGSVPLRHIYFTVVQFLLFNIRIFLQWGI